MRLAAQRGDPEAQFEVAVRFAEGKGVKQDFKQAMAWYERSARALHVEGHKPHEKAVARHLIDTQGAQIVLTGGPTETELSYGTAISAGLGNLPEGQLSNLIGKTSLKQLYAVLQMADLLICPDSGPAHMATAAGTPVVGLYATSNPLRTGPYLSQDLVVDAYPEAVRREFSKPVSELRWGERVRDPAAMDLISVEAVIAMCDQALANPRRPSAVIA